MEADVLLDPDELPDDATLVIINALAMRGFPPPMPGCQRRPCASCNRDTWAAPSSLEAATVRPAVYLCKLCARELARLVGGTLDVRRLADADRDVTAPGSLVTPEDERELLEELRGGGTQTC